MASPPGLRYDSPMRNLPLILIALPLLGCPKTNETGD